MKKANVSKKHHYVPKAILRKFCFNSETTFYLNHCNPRQGVEKRNIDSIFRRNHYNSFKRPDGTKDDTLERFYAYELDDSINGWTEVFERATKTGHLEFRSKKSYFRFIQFFYNHTKRTPDFLDPIVEDVARKTFGETESLEKLESRFRTLNELERTKFRSEEFQERAIRNTRVQNMSQQGLEILNRFEKMKIVVATPKRSNKQFIVGSKPVVRFENFKYQELGEFGVEMWTTLSPRLAVGFVAKRDVQDCIWLTDANVRKLNLELTKQSRAIASRSDRLLASLARSAGVSA